MIQEGSRSEMQLAVPVDCVMVAAASGQVQQQQSVRSASTSAQLVCIPSIGGSYSSAGVRAVALSGKALFQSGQQ